MLTKQDTQPRASDASRLPIAVMGWSLGGFLALSFTVCVAWALIFPSATMYQSWLPLLPGVSWISLPSFILGLFETVLWGWYIAVVFGTIFNAVNARFGK